MSQSQPVPEEPRAESGPRWVSVVALVLAALGLLIVLGWFYGSQRQAAWTRAEVELRAISELKLDAIEHWRLDREAEATLWSRVTREAALEVLSGDEVRAELLLEQCRAFQAHLHIQDVFLLDSQGQVRLSTRGYSGTMLEEPARQALTTGEVALFGPHTDPAGSPVMTLAAPVGVGHGTWVLVLDPQVYLYPLVQEWPTRSPTAETLLVRRAGEEVLFLNELRHESGHALHLRLPLTRDELPAVRAVKGQEGLFFGRDYRDAEVLAILSPVPGTDWYMVAKVEADEALADWNRQARLLALLALGLAGLVALGGLLLGQAWRRAQLTALLRSERARRRAEERYRLTLLSVGDGVLTSDAKGRVELLNKAAEELTGWSSNDAKGRPVDEVFHIISEKTGAPTASPVMEVLATGHVVGLANHTVLVRRDGTRVPIADSGAPILDRFGQMQGVVLVFQDRTLAREREREARQNEARLRSLVQILRDPLQDDQTLLDRALHQALALTGSKLGYVYRYSEEQRQFILNSWSRGVMDECNITEPEVCYELDKTGLWGEAVRQRRAIVLNDFQAEHPLKRGYPEGHAPLHRYLTVPVFSDGRIVAVVGVANKQTDYDELDELQLTLLMDAVWKVRDRIDAQAALRLHLAADAVLTELPDQSTRDSLEGVAEVLLEQAVALTGAQGGLLISMDSDTQRVHARVGELPERPGRLGSPEGLLLGAEEGWEVVPVARNHHELGRLALYHRRDPVGQDEERAVRRLTHLWGLFVEHWHTTLRLRERESALAMAQRMGHIGSWSVHLDTGERHWSEETYRIFGLDASSDAPLHVFGPISPADRERVERELVQPIMAGASADVECRLSRSDGKERWVRIQGEARQDESGRVVEILGTIQDLTEQHEADEERRTLALQLQQSQKMEAIGSLAGGVAHDFNNLLAVMQGYLELSLMELHPTDPMREDLEEVAHAARRAAALTRQLLAFSRRVAQEPVVLVPATVVEGLSRMLTRLLGETVELHVAEEGKGRVKVDREQLEQVLINLAVNARDAMPGGGTLTIRTSTRFLDEALVFPQFSVPAGRWVRIEVSDTGTGVPSEAADRIFEPFFTTKAVGKGTGLGLSVVYGIIKQSGGFIWVDSTLGEGTTFTILLPEVDEALGRLTPKVRPTRIEGDETVIVVEDDAAVRGLAVRSLERCGYTVISAQGGEQALDLAASHEGPIHLLLTDVVMPIMSGSEVASRLSAVRPELRVLYMSGYPGDEITQHGMPDSAPLLGKPFGPTELAAEVRRVLDSSR